ncbi:GNAT family N-acetyltransferase [Microbispora corallina]|uniref:GNAT family N-acetyltransferase n=1 Tax=Microbispora corallina TaxID=83302 RepID=UPI0019527777|nr:GNAT family N-acetyltransferase [Microbispora corallina]
MLPLETIPAGSAVLRLPNEGDAGDVARACADPDVVRYIPLVPSPYSRDDALYWITKAVPATWEAGGADFLIADGASGGALGTVGLKPPDRFGNSEVGYWLAPWARGRGVATEAVRALSAWGFAHGLPRITLLADVENVPSQRVAMRSGFTLEGVQRGAAGGRDGRRVDLTAYARLAGDPGDPVTPYLPFLPGGFPGGELTDGVVRLTPLTTDDAEECHRLRTVPDVAASRVPPAPVTYAATLDVCRRNGHLWLAGRQAEMAIRDARTGALAGDVQLSNVVPPLDQAMVGYSLHPEFRGRGFTARAVRLLADWAFASTPLRRLVAGTAPGNTASHRVLERAGFTRELLVRGLLPGPDGTRVDDLQWARSR